MKQGLITAVALCIGAAAAQAQTQELQVFLGNWEGRGVLQIPEEPEQRFQCRVRLVDQTRHVFMVGRCASTQGSTSFTYRLVGDGAGQVTGTNAAPVENALPQLLQGGVDQAGVLTLSGGEGQIQFQRVQGVLVFSLSADGSRGTALLEPR